MTPVTDNRRCGWGTGLDPIRIGRVARYAIGGQAQGGMAWIAGLIVIRHMAGITFCLVYSHIH